MVYKSVLKGEYQRGVNIFLPGEIYIKIPADQCSKALVGSNNDNKVDCLFIYNFYFQYKIEFPDVLSKFEKNYPNSHEVTGYQLTTLGF